MFYVSRDTEFVDGSGLQVHHVVDELNLGEDRSSAGVLHQGLDVTYGQTNEEVHDDDGEQSDVGSEEKVLGSCTIELTELRKNYFGFTYNKRLTCKL